MNTFDIHKNFIAVLGALALTAMIAAAHPSYADEPTGHPVGHIGVSDTKDVAGDIAGASSKRTKGPKSFVRAVNDLLGVKTPDDGTGTSRS